MFVITKVALLLSLLLISPLSYSAPADGHIDSGENSLGEMAKSAQNPVAAMISLPFQNNTNFNVGPEEKTQNILNIIQILALTNFNLFIHFFISSVNCCFIRTTFINVD